MKICQLKFVLYKKKGTELYGAVAISGEGRLEVLAAQPGHE